MRDESVFSFERSVDEVREVVGHAKLEESELHPLSQLVGFAPKLFDDDVKLIQVSKKIADQIQEGATLVIRGEDNEGAVLCTDNQTFDLKEAETSNSLLILPHIDLNQEKNSSQDNGRHLSTLTVQGLFYKYLELTEIKPKTQKLQQLLMSHPLTENEVRLKEKTERYTTQTLLNLIQASEAELKSALKSLECVEFRDAWYLLDQEFQMKILSCILRFFDENSWPLDCVHKKETVDTLKELIDEELLSQVFDIYCPPMAGGTDDDFSLDYNKVCRFYGDHLLSDGNIFQLDKFLEIWQQAVPEGLKTSLSQLDGLILVDKSSSTIRRFCESDLPVNIQDRLVILFDTRPQWTLEDITPFIEPVTTPKVQALLGLVGSLVIRVDPQLNVNALLTKYSRPINTPGGKVFCAKHGK